MTYPALAPAEPLLEDLYLVLALELHQQGIADVDPLGRREEPLRRRLAVTTRGMAHFLPCPMPAAHCINATAYTVAASFAGADDVAAILTA